MDWSGISDFIGNLLAEAPAMAKNAGLVAAILGSFGFVASLVLMVRFAVDGVFLLYYCNKTGETPPMPKAVGILASAVSILYDGKRIATTMSPDATWDLVQGRLEARVDTYLSALRFFAFAPLLVGLSGTILALADLLVGVGGNDKADAIRHLDGVFVGTLGGIIGSLLAGFGSFLLGLLSGYVLEKSEEFVQRQILPRLPHQKVKVVNEDEIFELISGQMTRFMEELFKEIRPISDSLLRTAKESANAGASAVAAFERAVDALQKTEDLGRAAETMHTCVVSTIQAAGTIAGVSAELARTTHSLTNAVDNLVRATGQIENTGNVLLDAAQITTAAATGLQSGAQEFATHARTALTILKSVEDLNNKSYGVQQEIQSSVDAQATVLSSFGQSTAGVIKQDLDRHVDTLCQKLGDALMNIPTPLRDAKAILENTIDEMESRVKNARQELPSIERSLLQLNATMGKMAASLDTLTRLQDLMLRQQKDAGQEVPVLPPLAIDIDPLMRHLDAVQNLMVAIKAHLDRNEQRRFVPTTKRLFHLDR